MLIRPVRVDDDLEGLFARIAGEHFHPHDLGSHGARAIAEYTGEDVFLVGMDPGPVAYGMLRGWDEGYSVPSLGVAVAPDARGKGYGRAMMLALHDAARAKGSTSIRLRVHPDNALALGLYRSLGYQESGIERGEIVMILSLLGPESPPRLPAP